MTFHSIRVDKFFKLYGIILRLLIANYINTHKTQKISNSTLIIELLKNIQAV